MADFKRVSCLGNAVDCWRVENDRVFWGSYRVSQWWLHTSEKVATGTAFEDVPLLGFRGSSFGGVSFVGSGVTYWNVIMSVDGFMGAMKYNEDCGILLQYEDISPGSYPRMFWNTSISLGLLIYVRGGVLAGRFTEDWLDFKSELNINMLLANVLIATGFKAMWRGAGNITLPMWVVAYQELNDLGITTPYLET